MVIRQMARDLAIATEVVACPTVREPDGLALSSRNVHLAPAERAAAPVLRRALLAGARSLGGRRAIWRRHSRRDGGNARGGAAGAPRLRVASPTAGRSPSSRRVRRGRRCSRWRSGSARPGSSTTSRSTRTSHTPPSCHPAIAALARPELIPDRRATIGNLARRMRCIGISPHHRRRPDMRSRTATRTAAIGTMLAIARPALDQRRSPSPRRAASSALRRADPARRRTGIDR